MCSLNLHAIQELNSTAFNVIGQSLSEDLGFFGGAHINRNDSAGGTTCMVAYSDLPEYYDVGRFHLLELGVYVVTNNFVCVNFYGLRRHGGTPAICPKGKVAKKWAVRGTFICYPNGKMLDGGSLYAFAALPHNYLMTIRPEMINIL